MRQTGGEPVPACGRCRYMGRMAHVSPTSGARVAARFIRCAQLEFALRSSGAAPPEYGQIQRLLERTCWKDDVYFRYFRESFGREIAHLYAVGATGAMTSRNNPKLAIAAVSARCLAHIAALRKAIHYVCAAHLDESNDFPYTAALEWRKAAELFGSNTPAAEYCWRQWERIMQLPRCLAGPISDSSRFALCQRVDDWSMHSFTPHLRSAPPPTAPQRGTLHLRPVPLCSIHKCRAADPARYQSTVASS